MLVRRLLTQGWQWVRDGDSMELMSQLFVINAIITLAVAGLGYVCCPDYPNKANPLARWLTPELAQVARNRLTELGYELPEAWSWFHVKETLRKPSNWVRYSRCLSTRGGPPVTCVC